MGRRALLCQIVHVLLLLLEIGRVVEVGRVVGCAEGEERERDCGRLREAHWSRRRPRVRQSIHSGRSNATASVCDSLDGFFLTTNCCRFPDSFEPGEAMPESYTRPCAGTQHVLISMRRQADPTPAVWIKRGRC